MRDRGDNPALNCVPDVKDYRQRLKLGLTVSERTLARYLRGVRQRGDQGQRWLTFLANHREIITALDFFTVPTVTLKLLYCFFVIEHGRRKIRHFNVTRHPWVAQQLREAFPEIGPLRYIVLDRDAKFNADVLAFLKATGLLPKRGSISIALAERHRATMGGRLSPRVT
jgi:putative transposase